MLSLVLAATLVVPWEAMTESNRALAQPVVEHYTLRREYAARTFRGRREQFEFLMDHIAACSVLAQSLGLIAYRAVEEHPGQMVADDREGARGSLQQVYCADGVRIYYVEGAQESLFSARGRGVVTVQFRQVTPDTIEYSGSMFVKIDSPIAAALAQAFFVFIKGVIDRHFEHVIQQPISLSRFARDDPAMLRSAIEQMPAADYWPLAPFADRL